VDLDSVKTEFTRLRARISKAASTVEEMCRQEEEEVNRGDAMEIADNEDRFGRDMYEACCLGAPEELKELTNVMDETQELVDATSGFFGERSEAFQDMLLNLSQFVTEFRRVKEDSEARRRRGIPDEFKF